jgi:hypothetical protein
VLEALVGLVAGLLVLTGLAIMAGPTLPRAVARLRRRPASSAVLRPTLQVHPTTARALSTASRLVDLLGDHQQDRYARALQAAGRRLQTEEAAGIRDMRQLVRHLRRLRLPDPSDQRIFEGLLGQLQKSIEERAEQLELLPKN